MLVDGRQNHEVSIIAYDSIESFKNKLNKCLHGQGLYKFARASFLHNLLYYTFLFAGNPGCTYSSLV